VPRFLRRELTVQLSFHFNLFEKVVEISQNHPPVRGNEENLLTLVTLQKDNPLQWIKDWIRWHNRMHGVGRLILYDNGSREYGYDELAEACTSEEKNFQSVLVNWDFPYTRRWVDHKRCFGGPWLQKAALNHWYLKYGDSGWLLNLDIDEYLVAEDATSLQDYIGATPQYYLPFRSRTMPEIGPEKLLAERSFRDFLWDTKTIQIFGKYACQCNGSFLMGIHSIDYGSLKRFSELLRLKLSSIVKRMQKLFRYHNKITHKHNLPRETFWVHHFALLASPCAPKPEK